MQLNPARGRKLSVKLIPLALSISTRFMQLNPARGRKLDKVHSYHTRNRHRFMQLNPARGRKLTPVPLVIRNRNLDILQGLCSSTPRGDGNKHGSLRRKLSFCKVYAAQPREGTETRISSLVSICRIARFMQLNPARGRKHDEYSEWLAHYGTRFMQLNPARGRKL